VVTAEILSHTAHRAHYRPDVTGLADDLDRVARETGFWGVVRVDRGDTIELEAAYGLADLAHGIPAATTHRYAIASGSKAMTALAVTSLVADGVLTLDTPARTLLGKDLPLVADDVTVEHLLAHRSGIGDYLDEDTDLALEDYLLPVGVQHLATTEAFLPVVDGYPQKFPAGTAFSYCNGGYIVLALLAERASGVGFHDLVHQRVLGPAGMTSSGFLRTDELPGDAAIGYLDVDGVRRSNVFHLPVRGNGDGGMYTTVADLATFWRALLAGAIVARDVVEEMVRPRSTDDEEPHCRYGLGFWLHPTRDLVFLDGGDTGVSFRSLHDPARELTCTVISNTTDGAWPISRVLGEHLGTGLRTS
jgi:CubicO group peptidase (beta-lactamase class C family)